MIRAESTSLRLNVTLAALLTLLAIVSLMVGAAALSPRQVFSGLFGGDEIAAIVVRDIRLPRTLLALLIGATFGLAGAALQGLLRNPLAEPALFGAPQAAALRARHRSRCRWPALRARSSPSEDWSQLPGGVPA
jgi:ABC-type Fe3+-siderophore transport system permease subunit